MDWRKKGTECDLALPALSPEINTVIVIVLIIDLILMYIFLIYSK